MHSNTAGQLVLAATDLSNLLLCAHKTALDLDVARKVRQRPVWKDELADLLRQRGQEHEDAYVARERETGREVRSLAHLGHDERDRAIAETMAAMWEGIPLIVQGALASSDGRWFGRPDVLRRVEGESGFGAWHYEAIDAKLASETRASTMLQLSLYSQLLEEAQGLAPTHFYVVTPEAEERYRTDDFASYFRFIRRRLEDAAERGPGETYPEPTSHCDVCVWWKVCTDQRRADDHLSFVANMTRGQRRELAAHDIETLARFGRDGLPPGFKPRRGARRSYERAAGQARVQWLARERGEPIFELITPVAVALRAGESVAAPDGYPAGLGLARLPEPSPGDLFLDLEGSAFACEGGREYLFGVVSMGVDGAPAYTARWAHDDEEERRAFEWLIDLATTRWDADPGMHIYHYAPYEPAAMKRLMGRYATREQALDRLLRGERFVDLYAVVRQAVRAGVETYSIKSMEAFYGFGRTVPLRDANTRLRVVEHCLELGTPHRILDEDRRVVQGYNEDDCRSTHALRDWLEGRRHETIASGTDVPRPVAKEGEPSKELKDWELKIEDLRARLLSAVPADPGSRTPEQRARYLLAYLIDFHRREDKVSWWEFYRLRDLPEEDYRDEPKVIADLEFLETIEVVVHSKTKKPTGSVVNRYRYPAQEIELRVDDGLKLPTTGEPFGTLVGVDRDRRTVDIKQGKGTAPLHPSALYVHNYVSSDVIVRAMVDLVEAVGFDLEAPGPHQAAKDLLLGRPPRLTSGAFERHDDESTVAHAVRIGLTLDHTTLAVQGPPGTGKTFTGAQMIRALVLAGLRVGVAANSHKVIVNLLEAVVAAAASTDNGVAASMRVVHRGKDEDASANRMIELVTDTSDVVRRIRDGSVDVIGGTAWLWSTPDMADAVDVLFIDEAGQVSLANALACSRAARSLVLLGDPQQLDQPKKGSHPDGVSVSALDHVIGGVETMPVDRGLFLETTWRLAPAVCAFTSEMFYERKLLPLPDLERQRINAVGAFNGSGLRLVLVEHVGNQNASDEEVDAVERIVRGLIDGGATWIDRDGAERRLTPADFRVIAPYNAQVTRLADRLVPLGIPVGTVDKFQGQEAPVVIYSMASSSAVEAPRGLDFLYSRNRLNVATSRAKCLCVVVANPRLFEPGCGSPHQMRLANALCRYRELAQGA